MKAEVQRRFGTVLMTAAMLSGALTVAASPVAVLAATDPGCTQLGGDDTTGTCEVNATVAVSGTINVGEPLHLLASARLDASASGVTINVDGDMTMDNGSVLEADDDNVATPNTGAKNIALNVTGHLVMAAGSRISANNNIQGGAGGNITIDVDGDMAMLGTAGTSHCRTSPSQGDGLGFYNYGIFGTPDVLYNASLGAVISAHRYGASASTAGGNINITVGNYGVPPTGTFTMQRCALIDVSSRGSAGEIDITAGRVANIDGLVLSESGLSGVGANQPRGGGPIDVRAGCELTELDHGVISSKGQDPGADLVHLKGCEVLINGVVQSTAPAAGHVLPTIPPNLCNNDLAAHPKGPSSGFDGCVRILGRNITIDGSGTHNGNVNVDGIRNPLRGWIDIFATEDITILGETAAVNTIWAVSANAAGSTNTFAGVVTIKAVGGKVHTEGQAILRANAAGAGSDGGTLTIQAGGSGSGTPALPDATSNVELNGSFIEANGPSGGTGPAGGVIKVKSFNGSITGVAGGHIQALGGPNPGTGSITLEECNPVDAYFGTTTANTVTVNRSVCGGQPSLPADAQALLNANAPIWAACGQEEPGTKSGHKYEDENANGNQDLPDDANIAGWKIWAIADDGDGQLQDAEVTAAVAANSFYVTDAVTGAYSFTLAPGSYFICEQSQKAPDTDWAQSSPVTTDTDYTAECDDANATADPDLAAAGYYITLDSGEVDTGNEFGNFRQATKSGFKFNDVSGDGVWDNGELGIQGWAIHLFGIDGQGAQVDLATTTGADGSYSFTVKPGSYTVCEETRTGWTQTFPSGTADCSGHAHDGFVGAPFGYAITLTSDETEPNNNFGNHQTPGNGTKSGHKYDDENGNGDQDAGEANLGGWKIWAIADDGDGELEGAEVTAAVAANSFDLTDAGTGAYSFSLVPGKYFICEEAQRAPDTDWSQSSPEVGDTEYTVECDDANATADPDLAMAGYYITLDSGEADTGNEFGNFRPAGGGEGCTPGFWQGGNGSHLWNTVNDPQWIAAGGDGANPFIHTTLFNSFFAPHPFLNGATVNEMLEIVGTGGGDVWAQKTARDVIAAYLNASFGLDLGLTPQEIKDKWAAAVAGGDTALEALHNELAPLNEQGCSL